MTLGVLDDVCCEALALFGKENQLRQAQEECGELVAAINQYLRQDRREDHRRLAVVEEIADVWIILTQLKMALPLEDFNNALDRKLKRLQVHIENEKTLRNQLSPLPTAL